jgi:hypothetical protein
VVLPFFFVTNFYVKLVYWLKDFVFCYFLLSYASNYFTLLCIGHSIYVKTSNTTCLHLEVINPRCIDFCES